MKTSAMNSQQRRPPNRSSHSENQTEPILKSLRSLALPAICGTETIMQLAVTQATCLRELLQSAEGRFDIGLLVQIPRVDVHINDVLPVAGTVYWGAGSWHIELNGNDFEADRRFAVLHELKHIIDHPLAGQLYTGSPAEAAKQQEQSADYFAACSLVPEDQLRQAAARLPSVAVMSAYFGASETCIEQRLRDTGLTPSTTSRSVRGTS
ncbi:hypothetical protein ACVWZ8_003318 [Arthrobacter sp. UYCu723]